MTREEAIKIIENEKECIHMRENNFCNGGTDCGTCKLVLPTKDILMAFNMAIEALQERPLQPPFKLKTLTDSTLMSMTKAELIEYARMCEKNAENAYAQIEQQAKNVKKLLDEQERPKGRWSGDEEDCWNNYDYHCTECGGTVGYRCGEPVFSNFCPNCGADMRGSEQG